MALVLTLEHGAFIFIGQDIAIRANKEKGKRWKVAIEAPKDIQITTSGYLKKQQLKKGETV